MLPPLRKVGARPVWFHRVTDMGLGSQSVCVGQMLSGVATYVGKSARAAEEARTAADIGIVE